MPLIQVEQDSSTVINRVHKRISDMLASQSVQSDDAAHCHGQAMFVKGYLIALRAEDLISDSVFQRLHDDLLSADKLRVTRNGPAKPFYPVGGYGIPLDLD